MMIKNNYGNIAMLSALMQCVKQLFVGVCLSLQVLLNPFFENIRNLIIFRFSNIYLIAIFGVRLPVLP